MENSLQNRPFGVFYLTLRSFTDGISICSTIDHGDTCSYREENAHDIRYADRNASPSLLHRPVSLLANVYPFYVADEIIKMSKNKGNKSKRPQITVTVSFFLCGILACCSAHMFDIFWHNFLMVG